MLWEEHDPDHQVTWLFKGKPTRESITAVLELLNPAHAHVHSLINFPETLIELIVARGVFYDWTLHDYYPICPRVHLNRGDAGTAANRHRPLAIPALHSTATSMGRNHENRSLPGASAIPLTCNEPGVFLSPAKVLGTGWNAISPVLQSWCGPISNQGHIQDGLRPSTSLARR